MYLKSRTDQQLVNALRRGGIAVFRADTVYGIFARADDPVAVERVYAAKGRNAHKSCIALIADTSQLYDKPTGKAAEFLARVWPGPVSVVIPSPSAPQWLLRTGDATLAYRCPDDAELRQLLDQTGPLIAPSANPEGLPPATNCAEAEGYFGEQIDAYVDSGSAIDAKPSEIYKISNGQIQKLR